MGHTDDNLISTSITITRYQRKWVIDKSINLSAWVRRKLDEEIGGEYK